MYNEASSDLKHFVGTNDITFQIALPRINCPNAAEWSIRTFKIHIIAGLCHKDPEFKLHLWDSLLLQTITPLNLMRSSRLNPQLSVYDHRQGSFCYNQTPLALPKTHIFVHEKAKVHGTWSPTGSNDGTPVQNWITTNTSVHGCGTQRKNESATHSSCFPPKSRCLRRWTPTTWSQRSKIS